MIELLLAGVAVLVATFAGYWFVTRVLLPDEEDP